MVDGNDGIGSGPHLGGQNLGSETEGFAGTESEKKSSETRGGSSLTRNLTGTFGRETVVARGTSEGLVLRLDNTVGRDALRRELWEFMESRRHFVEGNEVILEWLTDKPDDTFVSILQRDLTRDFGVSFKEGEPATMKAPSSKASTGSKYTGSKMQGDQGQSGGSSKSPSLFDGIEAIGINAGSRAEKDLNLNPQVGSQVGQNRTTSPAVWDDADSRMVYGTLRSGQKVETEHSVVIFGDVNSGAEIVAGGDVVVLGCLRGTAHAGAYDETGGGRVIFSLDLRPTQLRIGSVISRGASSDGNAGPEIARIDGAMIVVESYQAKNAPGARVSRV